MSRPCTSPVSKGNLPTAAGLIIGERHGRLGVVIGHPDPDQRLGDAPSNDPPYPRVLIGSDRPTGDRDRRGGNGESV